MKYDLIEDIRNSPEIMAKLRGEDRYYAQNLYCAFCNMQWCPRDIFPALRQGDSDLWAASWRASGGIIAELRNIGEDYMDYYCSGIKGGMSYDPDDDNDYFEKHRYVSEGHVTEEIAKDLASIGWFPVPYKDEELAP